MTPTEFMESLMCGLHSLCAAPTGAEFIRTVGFYDNPDELLDAAQAEANRGWNVWWGVHPLGVRPESGRGGSADVESVSHLVADIDWHDPVHADGSHLPEAEVMRIVQVFDPAPTIVVHSGHGLQAYWRLDAPVSPEKGATLTARLHAGLRAKGLSPERDDLASVLRVPGTFNRKTDELLEVRVLWAKPGRYTPEYLAKRLPAASSVPRISRGSGGTGSVLTDETRADLAPATAALVDALMAIGWYYPVVHRKGGSLPYVSLTRPGPGKIGGECSATVGFVAPDIMKCFTSGVAGFKREGRYKLDYDTGEIYDADEIRVGNAEQTSAPGDDDAPAPHPDLTAPDGLSLSDVGNAARLIRLGQGRLGYVHAWGKWIIYSRGVWVVDTGDVLVTEAAKRVARSLFAQVGKCTDSDQRKVVFMHARRSEAAGSIAAMIKLARGIDGVLVDHETLDADPELLNVRNGTVNLRTGELRPHDPRDLLTMQAPVNYDRMAMAPRWVECLDRWQPDPVNRDYLQREAGAGATGYPTETLSVHCGSGGNGKSKFWGAVAQVLGPYAVEPDKSLLVQQKYEPHATVVASMFRKRLGIASETSSAATLNDEMIKRLTGGDRLRARRMREDEWSFSPTHTLIMFSNHRPAVAGRDEGVWRRLRLVPWEVSIPEDERDPHLATKLKGEASGVLNWIVDGAMRFLADGLTLPSGIRQATDRYRHEEDLVTRFIDEVLRIGEGWMQAADLRRELERWGDDTGVPTPALRDVTEALRQHGCRSDRRRIAGQKTTVWLGVSVHDVYTPDPADQDF